MVGVAYQLTCRSWSVGLEAHEPAVPVTDSSDAEASHLLHFHEISLTPAVRTAAVC